MPDARPPPEVNDALIPYGWNERVAVRLADALAAGFMPGRVIRPERSAVRIVTASGEHLAVAETLPTVGDWVAVSTASDPMVIEAVAERWSALTRLDPHGDRVQLLAANIDLVLITCPGDRPSISRVERESLIAWDSGARPVVLVTKSDLAPADLLDTLERRLSGVDVVATSVEPRSGIDTVAALLQPDLTAVVLGPSGAGKSTLINALLGAERFDTNEVRDADARGRHTTTTREMVVVPSGGVIIDTPGLRGLGLATGDTAALHATFPDIVALVESCRFRDCAHDQEPGCAVQDAVARGTLDADRLASFLKLERELTDEEQRTDPVAARSARGRRKASKRGPKPR